MPALSEHPPDRTLPVPEQIADHLPGIVRQVLAILEFLLQDVPDLRFPGML